MAEENVQPSPEELVVGEWLANQIELAYAEAKKSEPQKIHMPVESFFLGFMRGAAWLLDRLNKHHYLEVPVGIVDIFRKEAQVKSPGEGGFQIQ